MTEGIIKIIKDAQKQRHQNMSDGQKNRNKCTHWRIEICNGKAMCSDCGVMWLRTSRDDCTEIYQSPGLRQKI